MLYDILIGIGLGCTPSMFQCLQCLQVFSSIGCSRQMFSLLRSRWLAIYPTFLSPTMTLSATVRGSKNHPALLAIDPRITAPMAPQKIGWPTSKDCQTTNHLSWFFVEDRSGDGAIMKIQCSHAL